MTSRELTSRELTSRELTSRELVGQNIRLYRRERHLTQKELAAAIGVTDKAVSAWENGTNEPLMGNVQAMADFFKVSKSQLLEGTYDKFFRTAKALDGIGYILAEIYGGFADKSVFSSYGESNYYLVGEGQSTFVLQNSSLDTLLQLAKSVFPPVVDKLKDTRSEKDVVEEIRIQLNDPFHKMLFEEFARNGHSAKFVQMKDEFERTGTIVTE